VSERDVIIEELQDLEAVMGVFNADTLSEDHPGWYTYQSLLQRQVMLRHQLQVLDGRAEVEMRLVGGAVIDNSIEAGFVGSFLASLQSTVSAIVQGLVHGSKRTGRYEDDVLNVSTLRLVSTGPGSFVLGMEGPMGRSAQLSIVEDEPLPPFDDAIQRLLDVVDAVERDVDGERLGVALSALGGHRPVKSLANVAKLLARSGTVANTVHRSAFLDVREAVLSPAGARRLQIVLSRTSTSVESRSVVGVLTGVRWKTSTFDLEVEDDQPTRTILSGTIVREIRGRVREAFDSLVKADIEVESTQTEFDLEPRITYRLVNVRPARH
jgi:hypothetical protein